MRGDRIELVCFDGNGNEFTTDTCMAGWQLLGETWNNSLLGISFTVHSEESEFGRKVAIPAGSWKETGVNRIKSLLFCFNDISGFEGDGGALFLPFDSGWLCYTREKQMAEYQFKIFSERKFRPWWINMPVFGAFANGRVRAGVCEEGRFEGWLRVRTNWGDAHEYRIDPGFDLRETPKERLMNENISVYFSEFDGDWRALALFYRQYNIAVRKLPLLKEKMKGNPDLTYAARALTVRFRMCVKPLPAQVLEQTPETQPKPHLYLSFRDVANIADSFRRHGVGPAEFNLVGWNYGGHDGAFPQLFPVEETCGGEEELKEMLHSVGEAGYPVSLHDNYFDAYTLANNLNFDDICHTRDGVEAGGGRLSGGQAYRLCPAKAVEYAKRNFAEVKQHLPEIRGSYYIDVLSLVKLLPCTHPVHPVSRRENAECYRKILGLIQKEFGVSMSEGARDWALPELDRAYLIYNCFDHHELPYFDEHVPFFQMVYHGFLIYNNGREGVNAMPGSVEYVRNLAWGGTPLLYFHHLFHPDWNASVGVSNDLTFDTQEKLEQDVKNIRQISDDFAELASLQEEFIDNYRTYNNTLSETCFSDGSRLFANQGESIVTLPDGSKLHPCRFHVIRKQGKNITTRKQNFFSLLELLVVIAIISILATLLLPTLNKARARGQAIRCTSLLKQYGQMSRLYENDFNGWTTSPENSGDRGRWFWQLRRYFNLPIPPSVTSYFPRALLCPGASYAQNNGHPFAEDYHDAGDIRYSFAKNEQGAPIYLSDIPGSYRGVKNNQIRKPAKKIEYADAVADSLLHTSANSLTRYLIYEETEVITGNYRRVAYRHNQRANLSFYDGHVDNHPYQEIYRTETGEGTPFAIYWHLFR